MFKIDFNYSDLTVSVAIQQLQLIQNFDQIAICFTKQNCTTGQNIEQIVQPKCESAR